MNKTVDVIIPVYKPDHSFGQLLTRLGMQDYPVNRIIVMKTERDYWNEQEYENIENIEIHYLDKADFDHGGTRNQGASYSQADIMVFMTDDAVPADRHLIGALAEAFHQAGEGGEPVTVAYARQLPRKDCAPAERFTRSFNYPEESRVKTKRDLEAMGIKTFFASNVCCAYDRAAFVKAGGFISRIIFNEDMIYAGHGVLQRGEAVAYAADARVIHSHNYGCLEQFHRNFDLAVSQADHPEVFAGIRSEGEGIRLVKQTVRWLVKQGKVWLIPGVVVKSGFKYLGYLAGKRYKMLPACVIRWCTMNRAYWENGK